MGQFMQWATSWSIFGKRVKSRKFFAEAAEAATSDHLPGNMTAEQINAATFCYSEEANMEPPPDKISVPSDFMLIHSDVVETIQWRARIRVNDLMVWRAEVRFHKLIRFPMMQREDC